MKHGKLELLFGRLKILFVKLVKLFGISKGFRIINVNTLIRKFKLV